MDRLLTVIDYIDDSLSTFYNKDIIFYGLCRLEPVKGSSRPVRYNGNKLEAVSFHEKSALSIYHRLISQSQNDDLSGGFGSNSLKTEIYTNQLIVFGSQHKISEGIGDINYSIASDIKSLIQNTFTSFQLNSTQSQSIAIRINSTEFDKEKVYRQEFSDIKEYKIKPDDILFSIEYSINIRYLSTCEDPCCPIDPQRECDSVVNEINGLSEEVKACVIEAICPGGSGGQVTILDQDDNIVQQVPCGNSYHVIVFSGIVDNGPPYTNSIIST